MLRMCVVFYVFSSESNECVIFGMWVCTTQVVDTYISRNRSVLLLIHVISCLRK